MCKLKALKYNNQNFTKPLYFLLESLLLIDLETRIIFKGRSVTVRRKLGPTYLIFDTNSAMSKVVCIWNFVTYQEAKLN
jgi:hypothetical protein